MSEGSDDTHIVHFSATYYPASGLNLPAAANFMNSKNQCLKGNGVDFYSGRRAKIASCRKRIWWNLPLVAGAIPLHFRKKKT